MANIKPIVLIILDGWGYAPAWGGNAIAEANTPNFDRLWRQFPHTTLHASGEWVGLTGHERGNSEVGHLNLGAGQVMMQDMNRITQAIENGEFNKNKILKDLVLHVKNNNSNVHIAGCLSEGAIHSHINHLFSILDYLKNYSELKKKVFIHIFTDGRDSAPQEAQTFISRLQKKIQQINLGQISTISGRYYAMDRDNHWERVGPVYEALTKGKGLLAETALSAIGQAYNSGKTDEFITPTIINNTNQTPRFVDDNDALIFFNFRADRARELTRAFMQKKLKEFKRTKTLKNLYFCTMTDYGVSQEFDTEMIYPLFLPEKIKTCLAQVLSENNKTQFHIAETEKYAHVTYFFNGGQERPFPAEDRVLIPSPRILTYDLAPAMSARWMTRKTLEVIKWKNYDFIIINFANADMVGHTGNYKAVLSACETVDSLLIKIVEAAIKKNGICMVTADHGNAEQMANPKTGEPDTEHTINPVPCIIITSDQRQAVCKNLKSDMKLANVTPTILEFMGIEKPDIMEEKLF